MIAQVTLVKVQRTDGSAQVTTRIAFSISQPDGPLDRTGAIVMAYGQLAQQYENEDLRAWVVTDVVSL